MAIATKIQASTKLSKAQKAAAQAKLMKIGKAWGEKNNCGWKW